MSEHVGCKPLRSLQGQQNLNGRRAEALRVLLYLFERDEAVPLISAG